MYGHGRDVLVLGCMPILLVICFSYYRKMVAKGRPVLCHGLSWLECGDNVEKYGKCGANVVKCGKCRANVEKCW